MTVSPADRYNELVESHEIEASTDQGVVVELLDKIYQKLMKPKSGWLGGKNKAVKGVYLWGPVGVGKTFLLELLYQALPIPKLRQHYHVFMQDIHQQLFDIQGTKDPLQKIAKNYAKKYRVFFLDEFIVNDVCSAMVLAGLLEALFNEGICLITTSNIPPDKLYEHGFPREPFLPAIDHLKNNTTVVNLESAIDYRRAEGHTHERYLTPLTLANSNELKQQFEDSVTTEQSSSTEPWIICSRSIPVVAATPTSVWFDFHVICQPPRSQLDYIAISHKIKHLYLSNVPLLGEKEFNQVSLFTKLIDVIYDEGIKLTMTAAAPIDEIYPKGEQELIFAFDRTKSRIIEMCS